MNSKLKNLIDVALAELGYHEGNNNDNKYGAEYGFNNAAWCVEFCWWICKHAGVSFPTTAHCNQVETYAREHGQWVTAPYKAGDFVIWNYDGNWENDHIGLVIETNGRAITTIEGNSGDSVRKNMYMQLDGIVGAYRPDYGEVVTDTNVGDNIEGPSEPPKTIILVLPDDGPELAALQYALHAHGYTPANSRKRNGDFDGELGSGTVNAATDCALEHDLKNYSELWNWLGGITKE